MKLSIITVNLNNRSGLDATINSVRSQIDPAQTEHLVIDGGSSDGSADLIIRNEDYLAYGCSEKDRGIYHAMNKGTGHARGEYLLFLNSGDTLCPGLLPTILDELHTEDIIYGDLILKGRESGERKHQYPDTLTAGYFMTRSLGHPATFIRSSLLKACPYNEQLKIVSDMEFFFRKIILEGCGYRHIPYYVSTFNEDGISSVNIRQCQEEHQKAITALVGQTIYHELKAHERMRESPLYEDFRQLAHTKKFQHRVRGIIHGLVSINDCFHWRKRKK